MRSLRPRRGRCRDTECGATHVLLPDVCLVRRRYVVEVIGEALRLAISHGLRAAAEELELAVATVRRWRARFRARIVTVAAHFWQWARALDGALEVPGEQRSAVEALDAIGVCASAASVALESRPVWSWTSALTAGGLLSPFNTSGTWPVPE